MSELQTTTVSEVAASNNAASPNGMAEGCAPSTVNDTWRENVAAQVRWFNRMHGLDNSRALLASAGSAATRTLTFTTAPASLFTGLIVGFKANSDFDADSTLNVNSLGAVNIQRMTSSGYGNVIAGDIKSGQHVWCKYDGTLSKWIMLTPTAGAGSSFSDPMTTRGDIIKRGAAATERLAIGAAETVLKSDGTDPSWVDPRGSTSDVRTGTSATKYLTAKNVYDAMAEVTLTDAATVAVDMATGVDFTVTLGGNRTLGNPTNTLVGRRGRIRIVQDGTGSRTLAYGTSYEFSNGAAPVLSTAAAAEDVLYYDCISSTRILCSLVRAIA